MESLALQLSDFQAEVSQYLGFGRSYSALSTSQKEQVDSVIKAGLRQFYWPPLLPDQPVAHQWSFLVPGGSLTTVANQDTYDLPEDFTGLQGDLNYQASESQWWTIPVTGEGRIRALQQTSTGLTGHPRLAVVLPKKTDGLLGQRFALLLYPTPDAAYVLSYRYHLLPSALTSLRPFPYGCPAHGETILESCLAVAESRIQEDSGTHAAEFLRRLQASVTVDMRDFQPEILGYNGDRSDSKYGACPYPRHGLNYVTYQGQLYP